MIVQWLIASYAPISWTTYATLNPSDKSADISLSWGDLVATNATAWWDSVRSTISKSSWKWYWECKLTSTAGWNVLIWIWKSWASLNNFVWSDANGWWWYNSSSKFNSGSSYAYWTWTFVTNDVIWVAMDLDAGTIDFYKNNTWAWTAYTWLTWPMFAMISALSSNITCNFWATTMEYTAPSWYNQWLYS